MSVNLSGAAIAARLQAASDKAGSLNPERRLDTKIDLSAVAIASRLREASDLLALCQTLATAARPK